MKTTSRVAAGLVAAAFALGGCGGGKTAGSSATSASGSSASTASATPRPGDTVDARALADRMTQAMAKAGSGTATMSLGPAGKASGEFAFNGKAMNQHLRMTVDNEPVELILKDGVIYLKGLPSSKPWVKIDPKAKDPVSSMFGQLSGALGDPRQLTKALSGATATVVSSSDSQVVYDITADASTVLGQMGMETGSSGGKVRMRYTIDDQGRPVSFSSETGGQKITGTFGDWGKPVSIEPPPANQVGTFQLPGS